MITKDIMGGYNLGGLKMTVSYDKYFRKGDTISIEGENYNVYNIKAHTSHDIGGVLYEYSYFCISSNKFLLKTFKTGDIDKFKRARNLLLEKSIIRKSIS